jgi:glycerol-3-phosphate cytidylyltransferase
VQPIPLGDRPVKSDKIVVLTYGTFDMFHIGHLNILTRLRELGDSLVVGVSTDEFNTVKGKKTFIPFEDRLAIVRSLKCVDQAFREDCWEQKRDDIGKWNASIIGMGADWEGRFDDLSDLCRVIYLPRTGEISSTELKRLLKVLDQRHVQDLKSALDIISSLIQTFE